MHVEPRPSGSPTPSELLASCGVIERVYLEHSPLLRRVAVRKFGIPPSDADTLVHDVFAAYIANPGAVRSDLRAYLIAAICNASRNYWRSKEMQERVESGRTEGVKERHQALRDLMLRISDEDSRARDLLSSVIATPYRFASARIEQRRLFRSGGVVRALCGASRRECDRRASFAAELARAACAIADALPDDAYPSSLVLELRGRAWKEYALSCHFLGSYSEAMDAIDRAQVANRCFPGYGPETHAIELTLAIILWDFGRYSEALFHAQRVAAHYLAIGSAHQHLESQEVVALILHRAGRCGEARKIYEFVVAGARRQSDAVMNARAACNLGILLREAGELAIAVKYFNEGLERYDAAGMQPHVARTQWSLGRLSLASHRYREAEVLLLKAIDLLEEHRLVGNANEALGDLRKAVAEQGRDEDAEHIRRYLERRESRSVPCTARNFIIEHYLRECFRVRTVARASELAERLNSNRSTLSRTMSQTLGRTLLSELRRRQLDEAARLLRTTDLTVAEVAARSAFGDRTTFFRVFRAAFDMTPGEYRKAEVERQQNTTLPPRDRPLSS
ncbi:MAG TPA: helix-turn-helix domain-containing protein [Thermoanaerobaculia bacterium]|jgi:AraC-like DNA-binding protein|nr:helix-turn-helix domain-containing protein [Thermoanaerobaculia bacterium]